MHVGRVSALYFPFCPRVCFCVFAILRLTEREHPRVQPLLLRYEQREERRLARGTRLSRPTWTRPDPVVWTFRGPIEPDEAVSESLVA